MIANILWGHLCESGNAVEVECKNQFEMESDVTQLVSYGDFDVCYTDDSITLESICRLIGMENYTSSEAVTTPTD